MPNIIFYFLTIFKPPIGTNVISYCSIGDAPIAPVHTIQSLQLGVWGNVPMHWKMPKVDASTLHKLDEEFLSPNTLYIIYGFLYMETIYKWWKPIMVFNQKKH